MRLNWIEKLVVTNPIRHMIQRHIEIPTLLEKAPNLPEHPHILEIGCGSGNGAKVLSEMLKPAQLITLDFDEHMISIAEKRIGAIKDITIIRGSASNLPFHSNSFDAVFDMGVLHHVPDWQLALKELHRSLKPGGVLYAEEFYKKLICNAIIRNLITHPQQNRFSHTEFKNEAKRIGFNIHHDHSFMNLSGTIILKKEEAKAPS